MKKQVVFLFGLVSIIFNTSCSELFNEEESTPYTDVVITSNMSEELTFLQDHDLFKQEYRVQTEGELTSVALFEDGNQLNYQSESEPNGLQDFRFTNDISILNVESREYKVVATLADGLTVESFYTIIVEKSRSLVELTKNKTGEIIEDTDIESDSTILYTDRDNTYIGYIVSTETPIESIFVNEEEIYLADTTAEDYEAITFYQEKEAARIAEEPQNLKVVVKDFFGNILNATYSLNKEIQ